ncbi:hypothetical protein GmHk_11G031609 [Glycine max]|nr:hypothetical protein GmHk_11G031609 [Glycine max]
MTYPNVNCHQSNSKMNLQMAERIFIATFTSLRVGSVVTSGCLLDILTSTSVVEVKALTFTQKMHLFSLEKSQLFILVLEQPSTSKKRRRDMEDRQNASFNREFEFKEEDNLVHNFPTASSVEVPSHESGSSNESTDISTPLTHDLGVYNQISSDQNTGSGSCLSTVRPANIHPQSQMKMQETVAGEINFDDDSAKKVIMAAVEYAKTYPRCEENQKFFALLSI